MVNDSTLPGCIGYHNHPLKPNGPCETCRYQDLCKKVIAKERLQPLVAKILEIEAISKGEEVNQG